VVVASVAVVEGVLAGGGVLVVVVSPQADKTTRPKRVIKTDWGKAGTVDTSQVLRNKIL
jgi:hypothetical protein